MSVALLEAPEGLRLFDDALPEPGDGLAIHAEAGPGTLDDLVSGAWAALAAGTAACPVCVGPLATQWAAAGPPVGGRCGSCGSVLA